MEIPTKLNNIPHTHYIRRFFYAEATRATKQALSAGKQRITLRQAMPLDCSFELLMLSPTCMQPHGHFKLTQALSPFLECCLHGRIWLRTLAAQSLHRGGSLLLAKSGNVCSVTFLPWTSGTQRCKRTRTNIRHSSCTIQSRTQGLTCVFQAAQCQSQSEGHVCRPILPSVVMLASMTTCHDNVPGSRSIEGAAQMQGDHS